MEKVPNTLLQKESYLAMIHNAVGSNLYRTLYMLVDGERQDILQDGSLSCAFFVSSILHQFNLVFTPHATVSGLERDLKESGWMLTDTPRAGDVLIWEPKKQADGGMHGHAGFYINEDTAISHSDKEGTPVQHHITFGTQPNGAPMRAVVAVYTYPSFV